MIATVLFWSGVALLAATYLGYPALLLARARVAPRPCRRDDVEPSISVIIAARNEAAVIADRLDDLLAQDYPAGQLEVVVASDGSTDGTDELVRGRRDPRIRVLSLPQGGKGLALNAAVEVARGEVLVFTDANTAFDPGALRALVRPFADPEVGGVAGDQRYIVEGPAGDRAGEARYWDLDRRLKEAQSRAGSVVSATGAIYAIRRELYDPISPTLIDDFHVSTGVVARGRRLVFEPAAVAREPVAPSNAVEYGRKVRIVTQGLSSVAHRRSLLDPRRTGFYAVQLLCHKLLRRLMVVPLLVLAVTAPLLWSHGWLYRAATVAQVLLYGAALAGWAWSRVRRDVPLVLALPLFFAAVNLACLVAITRQVLRRPLVGWEPLRSATLEPAAAGEPAVSPPSRPGERAG